MKTEDKRMNALVDEIAKKNSDVADMLELERVFRMDPLMIRRYLIEERAHLDYVANMEESREEGIEEGREEGIEEGRKDSARRLRSQGVMSDEQIANVLDIPLETVKTL